MRILLALLLALATQPILSQERKTESILNTIAAELGSDCTHAVDYVVNGSKAFIVYYKNKFEIDNGDMKIWYDGKTQWTLVESDEEVSVTEPDRADVETLNPFLMINKWNSVFQATYVGKRQKAGKDCDVVRLVPRSGDNFKEVMLYASVEKLVSLVIVDANNEKYDIRIMGTKVFGNEKRAFRFDRKNYPNVYINDLR